VSHPEKAIIAEVVSILANAGTGAGAHVFPSRKTNFRRDELPAIGVYSLSTDAEVRTESPRGYKNQAVVVCELWLESGLPIDTVMDPLLDLEWQVIRALSFNRYILDVECVSDFRLTGADRTLDPSGQRTTGESLVSFLVTYETEAETDASAVPFEVAQTTYDIDGNTDPGDQAEDRVELEGGTP